MVRAVAFGACAVILGSILYCATRPVQHFCGEAPPRSQCKNHLKQLGLALHSYHADYGCLPPACVPDDSGHPMHSWRVLLLPYLDEADLHGAYRFDEPWNGPNNSKLAGSIPNVFRCPSFDDAAFVGLEDSSVMSNYLCITGSQTAFPGTASVATAEILDGPSETVVVTEVKQHSVHWMQPKDIPAESAYEYLKSGDHTHIGGAQFLFGDGSVRFIQEDVPLTIFERLLSIADGDPVGKF